MLNDPGSTHRTRLNEIAIRAILERNVLGDLSESDLSETRNLYATAYALIRIGNAVAKYSRSLEQAYAEFPWVYWVNLRNELAHELGNVNVQRVWLATTVSIPELIRAITGEPPTP